MSNKISEHKQLHKEEIKKLKLLRGEIQMISTTPIPSVLGISVPIFDKSLDTALESKIRIQTKYELLKIQVEDALQLKSDVRKTQSSLENVQVNIQSLKSDLKEQEDLLEITRLKLIREEQNSRHTDLMQVYFCC